MSFNSDSTPSGFCGKCGNPRAADAEFCVVCGAQLTALPTAAPAPRPVAAAPDGTNASGEATAATGGGAVVNFAHLTSSTDCTKCGASLLGSGSMFAPAVPDGTELPPGAGARTCTACNTINIVRDWSARGRVDAAAAATAAGRPVATGGAASAARSAAAQQRTSGYANYAHGQALGTGKTLLTVYTVLMVIALILSFVNSGPIRLIAVAIWVPLAITMWAGKQGARIALGVWGVISIIVAVIQAFSVAAEVANSPWLTLRPAFWVIVLIGIALEGFGVYILLGNEDVKLFVDEQS